MGQEKDLKFTEAEKLADYIKANTELQVDYDRAQRRNQHTAKTEN